MHRRAHPVLGAVTVKRWLIPALIVVLMMPLVALATGTLTLPVTFGSLSAGVQNLSLFDQNFTAIRNYINTREVTYGTLAARPAAGTSGRYYYATDTSQFFGDNGSAWVNLAAGSSAGTYSVRGLVGANNTSTPATQFDFSADQVAVRSPSDGAVTVRTTTGTLTVNIDTAGPAANGRDQAAAFTQNTWLHVYFIWNGTTLASLASATAPPTGPSLPTGYTSWAYAGFVRYGTGSGGSLIRTRWRGDTMFYDVATTIVSNATAVIETTVSIASAVAPNATTAGLFISLTDSNGPTFFLRTVTGQNYLPPMAATSGLSLVPFFAVSVPNISQQVFFQWTGAPSSGATISVINAVMPNGGA